MATTLGYRIGIDARKFCKNDKSCFYIYVDLLRDRTVQDITNKIKLMLQVDTSIWLLNGIFYLPPTENVRLFHSGDILQVVEQCEAGLDLSDCLNGVEKENKQIFPKEKKKRKRKHKHDNSVTDIEKMDIEKCHDAVGTPIDIDNTDHSVTWKENSKPIEVKSNKRVEEEFNIQNTLCKRELERSITSNEYSKPNGVESTNAVEEEFNTQYSLCRREVGRSITSNEYSKLNGIESTKPVKEEFNIQNTVYKREVDRSITTNGVENTKPVEEEFNIQNTSSKREVDRSMTSNEYSIPNELQSSNCLRSSEIDDDLNESVEVNDLSVSSCKNMEKVIQEENGEIVGLNSSIEHPKKRRRTRIRRHKKKQNQMLENKHIPLPTFKSKVYAPQADVSRTHIRFTEDEDGDQDEKVSKPCESRVTENAAVELDPFKTPLLLDPCKRDAKLISGNSHLTKWDVKSTIVNLLPKAAPRYGMINETSVGSEAFAKLLSFRNTSTPLVFERKRKEDETSSPQLEGGNKSEENLDISKYPKLSSVPKEGDVIAFKMLKMDANYTPVISEYIMAKVLSACSSTHQLLLFILDDGEQCKKTKGKFDLEVEDDESSNDRLNLNWNELHEARLLYP